MNKIIQKLIERLKIFFRYIKNSDKEANASGKNIFNISKLFSKKSKTKKVELDTPAPLKRPESNFSLFAPRLSLRDQTLFAKRLSFLIKAGVPILESLHILKSQMRRGSVKVFDRLIVDISNGQFLHTSLARFRRTFGDFAINIIKVGETSGVLGENLNYLAEELKKRNELRKKVIGSLVYPVFITIATIGVATLLTAYIFPKIMPIFSSLSVELPWTTRALIGVSDYLQSWGILTLILAVAVISLIIILHKTTEPVKSVIDRLLLKIPIIGKIMLNYNMANFCRTLGILLKGGMTVTQAVRVTGDTTHNWVYRKEAYVMADKIVSGKLVSNHLDAKPKVYPSLSAHMVAIGEKTGNLSETFMYLADMYEHEVDDMTKNLSSSIEPILMVFMGLIVGFVAVSVITPIYEVTKNLQR